MARKEDGSSEVLVISGGKQHLKCYTLELSPRELTYLQNSQRIPYTGTTYISATLIERKALVNAPSYAEQQHC